MDIDITNDGTFKTEVTPQSSRKSFSVPILGESYEVIVVETTEHIKNEIGQDEFELYFGDTSAVGMCISPESKIYICENSAVTQEDFDRHKGIKKKEKCAYCESEDAEDSEFYILPLSTKDRKITVVHELLHGYFDVLNPEISENEDLIEMMSKVVYHMIEVDKCYETAKKEMGL
jgi:hypothetical protein